MWIYHHAPVRKDIDICGDEEFVTEQLCHYLDNTWKPDLEEIKNILRTNNFKMGKWFVVFDATNFNRTLAYLIEKQEEGELWDFKYIKQPKKCALCAYHDDMDDLHEIMRMEKALRACGITEPMYWKPDAFTLAGIYSGNEKLRPYIYKSRFPGDFTVLPSKKKIKGIAEKIAVVYIPTIFGLVSIPLVILGIVSIIVKYLWSIVTAVL